MFGPKVKIEKATATAPVEKPAEAEKVAHDEQR